jgi:tRNA nucleotidyltransferase (CCA-adding enzyme)
MSAASDLLLYLKPGLLALGRELAHLVDQASGSLLIVGGSVRDLLDQQSPQELDLEVHGIPLPQLKSILEKKYQLDEVGKAFGVIRLRGVPVEIALPRTEIKTGQGHKGFSITMDPDLPFEKAVMRRDFTINAMGIDLIKEKLLDPCRGAKDWEKGILRHVGPAFTEDPLRVLRAMQFIARFNLTPDPETIQVCQSMEIEGLAPERVYEEWKKLLIKGKKISAGLHFLHNTKWLRYFPELEALVGCRQDPEWHPEGDVWIHTLHCLDAFSKERVGDEWEDLVVGFAVLCHDMGKPLTTEIGKDGRIRSPLHEPKGETPTRSFLSRLTKQVDLHEEVVPLVRRHLTPRVFYQDQASDGAIRRLANKVKRIDRLVRVAAADISGRPPRKDDFPEGPWLLKRAEELQVRDSEPVPLILGRHLIQQGLSPGARFGPLLSKCYEAQMDGIFNSTESGIQFLNSLIKNSEG